MANDIFEVDFGSVCFFLSSQKTISSKRYLKTLSHCQYWSFVSPEVKRLPRDYKYSENKQINTLDLQRLYFLVEVYMKVEKSFIKANSSFGNTRNRCFKKPFFFCSVAYVNNIKSIIVCHFTQFVAVKSVCCLRGCQFQPKMNNR